MTDTRYPCLAGRTVIITGGASGIGAAFVRAFATNGARVGFLDLDAPTATALIAEIAATGAPAPIFTPVFVSCDLLDIPALQAALAALHARLGDAAVLINNAANDRRQDFPDVTEAEFDWSLAVNFKHHYFAAQAILPQMQRLGHGSIINMSSIAWMGGGPRMQAYSAAKAAVVGFTNSLARDVGKHRIRVNAIAPGMVITPRQRELWYQDESLIAAGRARQCLPDPIEPEDIANLALFLAADDSRLITKQCFQINGGAR
jgi:NAD(P)-dependent dehydrogenase (short-subunit alcohol dehydrogenase family)